MRIIRFIETVKNLFAGNRLNTTGTSLRHRVVDVFANNFNSFGANMQNNDLVISCIECLCTHTSKGYAKAIRHAGDEQKTGIVSLEKMLNIHPNPYMNGVDYLRKVRWLYEFYNNVFIFIDRFEDSEPRGFYPINYSGIELVLNKENPLDTVKGILFTLKMEQYFRLYMTISSG